MIAPCYPQEHLRTRLTPPTGGWHCLYDVSVKYVHLTTFYTWPRLTINDLICHYVIRPTDGNKVAARCHSASKSCSGTTYLPQASPFVSSIKKQHMHMRNMRNMIKRKKEA